ncbi:hypothetical protein B0H11DRAFT_2017587 [Mycena galericulata]|nr:hypothetical protein B0H11DRAFT_2017587 [Mycena galericulata]
MLMIAGIAIKVAEFFRTHRYFFIFSWASYFFMAFLAAVVRTRRGYLDSGVLLFSFVALQIGIWILIVYMGFTLMLFDPNAAAAQPLA